MESRALLPYNPEITGLNHFPNKSIRSSIFKVRNGEREGERKGFKKLERKEEIDGGSKLRREGDKEVWGGQVC